VWVAGPAQRERDDRVADRKRRVRASAGGDDYILAALPLVGHRRRDARGGQPAGPELGAGFCVKGAQVAIERSADEEDSAARDERAAEIRSAPARREAEGPEILERAEVGLPEDL